MQSICASLRVNWLQMDDKRHEEFARAKQFKKLNKLLGTPEAKRPITQFRTFAVYVLAIVVILQVICFVVDRILMNKISKLISTGSQTMTALTSTVQIQYAASVLWSTFDSYAPPGWNTYNVATREYIGVLYTSLLASYVSSLCYPTQARDVLLCKYALDIGGFNPLMCAGCSFQLYLDLRLPPSSQQ